ncbi:MAG: hypothetical protein KKG47_12775 [Proteobacteria bacterium]|nr:hypothetical protein [Pseudomonadota bacterium]MBU1738726.1 hypothetical protein [Pseudomonadota bacterium]
MAPRYIAGVSKDRRRKTGADFWGSVLRWLGVSSWILMFSYLALGNKARPEVRTELDIKHDIAIRADWDIILAKYIFILMILGLVISIIGFFVVQKRNRRRTDEFTYSVLILGLVSACGIIYYLFAL